MCHMEHHKLNNCLQIKPWGSSRLILGPNKTSGHAQTIQSLSTEIYIYSHNKY